MAAPSVTARTVPSGPMMPLGMRITIAFALNASINFAEKDPQPPGWDGGEPSDITTQFNLVYRTFYPRFLVTMSDSECTVAYNPGLLSSILALLNKNTSVTYHFPDHSAWAFWGYLQKFVPTGFEDGKQPEAKVTIKPTNYDDVNGVEASAIYQSAGGTP